MSKIELSSEKIDEISTQIDKLLERREVVVKQLNEAREKGDLSENAEYSAAKEELGDISKKISKLENTLTHAVRVDKKMIKKDFIDIFAHVKIENVKDLKVREYTLVSEVEASPMNNKISINSPIGRALKNKKTNDKISVKTPAGISEYKIISFNYD